MPRVLRKQIKIRLHGRVSIYCVGFTLKVFRCEKKDLCVSAGVRWESALSRGDCMGESTENWGCRKGVWWAGVKGVRWGGWVGALRRRAEKRAQGEFMSRKERRGGKQEVREGGEQGVRRNKGGVGRG